MVKTPSIFVPTKMIEDTGKSCAITATAVKQNVTAEHATAYRFDEVTVSVSEFEAALFCQTSQKN